jgi:hypothetical protein
VLRWAVLAAAATALFHPFHTHRSIGAGDAYWYTLVLADFVEQMRAGQFPVWVGATEHAFNGATSPLRLAPWFQHAGALLDLATAGALAPVALKNALLVTNAAALAASAYAGLRLVLPHRPWLALLLALAVLASPATLAPVYVGDQYMTFLALTFLPWVATGLWRVATRGRVSDHVLLGFAGGGLWLAHPPIALWTTLFAGVAYAVTAALGRRISGRGLAAAVAVAVLTGGYPVVSALSLDNVNTQVPDGEAAATQVARAFPAIVRSLSPLLNEPSDYQGGALLLALFGATLVAVAVRRPPAALGLAVAAAGALYLVLPAPGVAAWWEHMPAAVMRATNSWPMQRLVPLWAFLAVFATAALLAAETGRLRGRRAVAAGVVLALGLVWSGREAGRFIARQRTTISQGESPDVLLQRHNLLLTRYSFVSFGSTPAYYSHGYMDPILEHRLLRRDGSLLAANAESAVRRGERPAPVGDGPVARGVWRAVNDNHSTHYFLEPALAVPAATRLALLVEPRTPPLEGWIQFQGRDLFREYLLPDSGAGVARNAPPRSFGLLPTSSRVMSLYSRTGETRPRTALILPGRPDGPPFEFADYELWRFDPADLPVKVRSLVPYRLEVDSPEPAFVEVPRVWLKGYRTKIHGERVHPTRSADDLLWFPVPAGRTEFIVKWVPPLHLELAYWTWLGTWGALAIAAALRRRRGATAATGG